MENSGDKAVYHPDHTNSPKKYIKTPVIYLTGLYTIDIAKRQLSYNETAELSEPEVLEGIKVWVTWMKKGVIEWDERPKCIWDAHVVADFLGTPKEYRKALQKALLLVLLKRRRVS
jgi:hypothetical protein